ncbi:putative reverse transcriptase domain-containing protein, partial [Tanacetum coccineum]
MMTDEYCLRNELQRMEYELWNLTLKGDDIDGYTNRFYELAALCPSMVTPEYKKIERLHHNGQGIVKCGIFQKVGHLTRNYRVKTPTMEGNTQQAVTCFGCGEKGHYKNKCPKRKDQQNKGARGRAYVMRTEEPQQDPNVVTSTFLLNNHYASILFDSGADKSFVSATFSTLIDIAPSTLDTSYEVELANGKV